MERKKETARMLQETLASSGWELIENWLKESEEKAVKAGVKNILNLKADEFVKWQPYYAGVLETISSFRNYIENTIKEKKVVKTKNLMD